ncbi:MAG: hypothetical protein P857_376 [Candidatus Xenolissoclinum pacificiensis L6]|uniref:Uncharacterized protein n=1 Tax=Candidatus Xenolissoclinum pacificiensis L6 TaxID=1401685 RepID=W2UZ85_9RICK|nr:MAG: hypothetical protein P857_376 [Candidatus Xenolissoclinum pacificiensis L6]
MQVKLFSHEHHSRIPETVCDFQTMQYQLYGILNIEEKYYILISIAQLQSYIISKCQQHEISQKFIDHILTFVRLKAYYSEYAIKSSQYMHMLFPVFTIIAQNIQTKSTMFFYPINTEHEVFVQLQESYPEFNYIKEHEYCIISYKELEYIVIRIHHKIYLAKMGVS